MFENTVLSIAAIISGIHTISYGIWTIKNKNIIGGISVIFMSLTALLLVGVYIVSEII